MMVTHWRKLFARIRHRLMRDGQTVQEAEDLIQEAWIRLACYQRDHTVERPEAFLMRTAINLSIDSLRAQKVRGEAVEVEDEVLYDPGPSVEDTVHAQEQLRRVAALLWRLDQRTRDIFVASRVHGLGYQEIARTHRLSVSSVEKIIASATLQIMQGLGEA